MENYNDIVHNLKGMQGIQPSERLRKRLGVVKGHLPAHHSRQIYGGFVVSMAMAVLLLFVLTGSGVALAARGSQPGSPLFPIKKVLVHAQIQLTSDPKKKDELHKEIEEPEHTGDDTKTTKQNTSDQGKASEQTSGKNTSQSGDDHTSHTSQTSGSNVSGSNTSGSNTSNTNTSDSHTSGQTSGGSNGSGSTPGGSGDSSATNATPTPTPTNGSNGSGSTPGGSGNVSPTPTTSQPPTPTPTKKPEDDK